MYLCTSWTANFSVDCTVYFQPTPVFFYAIQRSLSFVSEECDTTGQKKITLWSLIHTTKHTVTWCICMCYGLLRIRIHLLCILLSIPLRWPVNENLRSRLTDELQIQCGPECTHAIRDNLSQDTLLLKGTKTNCLSMLMPKVYHFLWCLCYILVQFPPYSRWTVWNIRQEAM